MIRTINITAHTKSGDLYDEVAINKFPIIITGESEDISDLYDDGFISTLEKHIKSQNTFNSAKLYIRTIEDESQEQVTVKEDIIKLSDVIPTLDITTDKQKGTK